MKLWIDDVRPAPEGYVWCKSVSEAKVMIVEIEQRIFNKVYDHSFAIVLIDVDHDAGECAYLGGDYIRLLDWLEETGRNYPIRIHSQNPVGIANGYELLKEMIGRR